MSRDRFGDERASRGQFGTLTARATKLGIQAGLTEDAESSTRELLEHCAGLEQAGRYAALTNEKRAQIRAELARAWIETRRDRDVIA